MRIHRLKVNNFRGIGSIEINLPEVGVTIIEGDNEVGKTSLSDAIDLIFTERDDSKKQIVKAIQPIGKDVGSEVEIEVSSGPYRFVYRKRWNRQRETVLEIFEPKRLQLTSREAHDKVREILDETLDANLWDAMRLDQEAKLEHLSFAGGSLARALDIAASGRGDNGTASGRGDNGAASGRGDSAQIVGLNDDRKEDDLWERIVLERDRYWTARDQPRGDRLTYASKVSEVSSVVSNLETLLDELETDINEVDRLVAARKVMMDRQKQQESLESELIKQVEEIRSDENELRGLEPLLERDRSNRERLVGMKKSRTDLIERVKDAQSKLRDLESQLREAVTARKNTEVRLSEAKSCNEICKGALSRAESAHRLASDDAKYLEDKLMFEQMTERRDRVSDAIARRSEAELEIEANLVDEELLQSIEEAHTEVAISKGAVDTGATHLLAEALDDIEFQIDGSGISLLSGDKRDLIVTDDTELIVAHALRVTISPGPQAKVLAGTLKEARARLESICERAGVVDLVDARRANTVRNNAERIIQEASKSIKHDLRDLSVEELSFKVEQLSTRLATYELGRIDETPLPRDIDTAQRLVVEAADVVSTCNEELKRSEGDLSHVVAMINNFATSETTAKALLESAQITLTHEQEQLDQARNELSDDHLEDQLRQAESVLSDRSKLVDEVKGRLGSRNPEFAHEQLRNAKEAKNRLASELHDNDIKTRDLRTTLSIRGEEGLASKLDVVRKELAYLIANREQLEARANAAKLLHDVFAKRRAEAHHRYVAPFRESIERLGSIVFGSTFQVELDADLSISRRTLDGVTLDFSALSAGAREQLNIISRLACATIVDAGDPAGDPAGDGAGGAALESAGDGADSDARDSDLASSGNVKRDHSGAPVIFDDALGWSDPRRLADMGAVISAAGASCQIIVLTCTPDRYANVGRASVVRFDRT